MVSLGGGGGWSERLFPIVGVPAIYYIYMLKFTPPFLDEDSINNLNFH